MTPPTTSVSGAGAGWHDKPVTLHFRATDNPGGQGVAYTEYSLDGGTTWTKGTTVTVPAPADHSNDGVDKVLYRSVDNVGNVETPRVCRVRIDTRRPTPVAKWPAAAIRGARTALRFYVERPAPRQPHGDRDDQDPQRPRHAREEGRAARGQGRPRPRLRSSPAGWPRGPTGSSSPPPTPPATAQTAAAVNTLVVR